MMMDSEFGPGEGRPSGGDNSERRPAPPGGREHAEPRRVRDLVFLVLLLLVFLEILRQATSFTGVAQIAPLFLGALGAFFSAFGSAVTAVALVRQRQNAQADGVSGPQGSIRDRIARASQRPTVRAAVAAWLWVAGFAAVIWSLGFVVGGGLFGLVFLRVAGNGWVSSVLTVGIPLVLFAWVVPSFLIVEIYQGILLSRFF